MSPRPRVLCAEPYRDVSSLVRLLLDSHGFDADTAPTVEEAEALAGAGRYCLYVVGDDFPDGTHLELIRRLRAATPEVPVLAFSGYSRESDREAALGAGADVYLVRPRDYAELVHTIVTLCGGEPPRPPDEEGGRRTLASNKSVRALKGLPS